MTKAELETEGTFGELRLSDIGFAAGAALMSFILLRRYFAHRKKQRKEDPREPVTSAKALGDRCEPRKEQPLVDAPNQVLRWQVEMFDLVRDFKAEVNSRLVLLQSAVKSAESQAERLEKLIADARRLGLPITTQEVAPYQELVENIAKLQALSREPYSNSATSVPQSESGVKGPIGGDEFDREMELHRKVSELARVGIPPLEISKRVGLPLGEIELLIATTR